MLPQKEAPTVKPSRDRGCLRPLLHLLAEPQGLMQDGP